MTKKFLIMSFLAGALSGCVVMTRRDFKLNNLLQQTIGRMEALEEAGRIIRHRDRRCDDEVRIPRGADGELLEEDAR